ncbi:ankyrin repeat-containing protein BDA1-like isoform X1 [Actinidia eriantha]|uniref:ankyrin repeat-containing protein BDA1-like isoform X1 n=2 Tax=Actinidia eriantha TaxID=165200 RepID=UPI00258BF402|nr:ankyrin repeat-containing protein BDA1-like isoform X1 [Actinidia eriantha]
MGEMPYLQFAEWYFSTGHFEHLKDLDLAGAALDCCDANKDGFTPLHLACWQGHLEAVERLIKANKTNFFFVKDKYGQTPLHIAAMKGRVEVVKMLVESCHGLVKEVSATGETCLHTAVVYNKGKVIQYLTKWLGERTDDNGYLDLINGKDRSGNTVLHLATSRKQLQIIKLLLAGNQSLNQLVEVNAKNSGGFTPLDILDVLPYSGKIDMEIDKVLRRAGALRARDLTNQRIINNHYGNYDCTRNCYNPSYISAMKSIVKMARQDACNGALLMIATLLATITYQAGFSCLGSAISLNSRGYNPNRGVQVKKHDSSLTHLFILFNSAGFISSVGVILFLLHEFPLKPWPQITVSTMFCAYMCLIMAVSPNEALALLLLTIPFLLLALYGLGCRKSCVRIDRKTCENWPRRTCVEQTDVDFHAKGFTCTFEV